MDWSKFFDYGIEGLVIAALFFVCYKLGMRILDQNAEERKIHETTINRIVEQHSKERDQWLGTINDIRQLIALNAQKTNDAWETQKKAIDYAREEHKELILICGRINGYKNHGESG